MSSQNEETTTITARCLCKAHKFTATVPTSSLPFGASFCHCTSCRRVSGALYTSDVKWPVPETDIDTSKLVTYEFSKNIHLLFCGTCSSPMFFRRVGPTADGSLGALTGCLSNTPNLVRIDSHIFVGDTLDGGASMWLRNPNRDGPAATRWVGRVDASEQIPHAWAPGVELPRAENADAVPAATPLRCHCGGVALVLRSGGADYAGKTEAELPWFVEPGTGRTLASFDACDSCRLSFGADVPVWTFAAASHVAFPESAEGAEFPASGRELERAVKAGTDPRLRTLAIYKSSPDVSRYFCSKCSACVFYATDDRPQMLDVAVGLLDAPEGSRAESLLHWNYGRVSFKEDCVGGWRETFVESLEKEAEAWRIERGYPKCRRRLQGDIAETEAKTDAQ